MLRDFDITNRTAVITGGAQGIGEATAHLFAEAGARVILLDKDADAARKTAESINASRQGAASWLEVDVSDRKSVAAAAQTVEEEFGAPDILVNNAGIVRNVATVDATEDDWQSVLDVNLNGIFYCSQFFGKQMIARKRGSIINITSVCGEVSSSPQPQLSYNTSKGGINLLTKSLAAEWAVHGIRVNAVAPGYVHTDMTAAGLSNRLCHKTWLRMTPLGRLADPREIASSILFLASDAASFVTGAVLNVDGGYTAV